MQNLAKAEVALIGFIDTMVIVKAIHEDKYDKMKDMLHEINEKIVEYNGKEL